MNPDSLFRMSVINACFALARHRSQYPSVNLIDAVTQLRRGASHLANLNYPAALQLIELAGLECFCYQEDREQELRETLLKLAITLKPLWARASVYGRSRTRRVIGTDQEQCLRSAGLYENPPDEAIIAWWDKLADQFRSETAKSNLETGREGERLSIEYERQRLSNIGLEGREPVLVSIDDNAAGYDIISYDFDANGEVTEIRIEVKASSVSPARFIITANEWEVCQENPSIYRLHVWELKTTSLKVLQPANLRPHIPINIGLGRWTQAEFNIKDILPD